MKNLSALLCFLCLALTLSQCKKLKKEIDKQQEDKVCPHADQICDSARVSVSNTTQDTIYYRWSWAENQDTLLPNETDRIYTCNVKVTYDKKNECEKHDESVCFLTMESSWGVWAIKADHCDKKVHFRYDQDNVGSGLIFLYNATDQ